MQSDHYLVEPRDSQGRWTTGGAQTEIVSTIKDAGAAIKAAASDYSSEAAIYERSLELNRKAIEATPEFEEKVKAVNAILNGTYTGVNLKRVERIAEKAQKEYGGDVDSITDPIRTTIVIDSKSRYDDAINAFKKAGAEKVKFQHGETFLGYTGVLAKFKLSNGVQSEVQANYPEMLYAKEIPADAKRMLGEKKWNDISNNKKVEGGLGHKYYEDFRKYQGKIINNTLTTSEKEFLHNTKIKSMNYYKNFY